MTADAGDPTLEVPSAARAYDYFLGGAHNFEVDRAFAEQVRALVPWVPDVARLNRSFLWRANPSQARRPVDPAGSLPRSYGGES